MKLSVKILVEGRGLPLPSYQTAQAAGLDLLAAIPSGAEWILEPGARKLVPCGFAMQLPAGFEAQIRPRSGLALKNGVTVLNSPGTVDADFRGPVAVCLINHSDVPFSIWRGDRIAQMVIAPVVQAEMVVVEELESSARGEGGFGSTGVGAAV